jgi:hypothetical protein
MIILVRGIAMWNVLNVVIVVAVGVIVLGFGWWS